MLQPSLQMIECLKLKLNNYHYMSTTKFDLQRMIHTTHFILHLLGFKTCKKHAISPHLMQQKSRFSIILAKHVCGTSIPGQRHTKCMCVFFGLFLHRLAVLNEAHLSFMMGGVQVGVWLSYFRARHPILNPNLKTSILTQMRVG